MTPSAESSTGEKKISPPGMFAARASILHSRPSRLKVKSVPSPTIRTEEARLKRSAIPVITCRKASQSMSTAP